MKNWLDGKEEYLCQRCDRQVDKDDEYCDRCLEEREAEEEYRKNGDGFKCGMKPECNGADGCQDCDKPESVRLREENDKKLEMILIRLDNIIASAEKIKRDLR